MRELEKNKDDSSYVEEHGPLTDCMVCQPHSRLSLLHMISPTGFKIINTKWQDVMKDGQVVDGATYYQDFIDENGKPTMAIVHKGGFKAIYGFNNDGTPRTWMSLGQFAVRIYSEAMEKELPNASKRMSLFTRPTPVAKKWNKVEFLPCRFITNDKDEVIGYDLAFGVMAPVHNSDTLHIGILPKHKGLDGVGGMRRSIFINEIGRLVTRMTRGYDTHAKVRTLKDPAQRKAAAISLRKATAVAKRLEKANAWNIRLLTPNHEEMGGLFKGDVVLSKEMGMKCGLDAVFTLDNLKPEMFTEDDGAYLIADVVHDSRKQRWTNRQSMAHHSEWFYREHIINETNRLGEELLENVFVNGTMPGLTKDQDKTIDKEFVEDSMNLYEKRYNMLAEAGVLQDSFGACRGLSQRFIDKLQPSTYLDPENKIRDEDDNRSFADPASEYRTVNPMAIAKMMGWVKPETTLKDGLWFSSPIGVIMNDKTALFLAAMSGKGDFDDHWLLSHFIAKSDAIIRLFDDGSTINIEAGKLYTLFVRMPIGVGGDKEGKELGSEYMILQPTEREARKIMQEKFGTPPVINVNSIHRPKRLDEIDFPRCPSTCDKQDDDHRWGHPTFEVTTPSYGTKRYSPKVIIAQLNAQQDMIKRTGAIGGMSNMTTLMMAERIPFVFMCDTETFTDITTKSTPDSQDVGRLADIKQHMMERVIARAEVKPVDKNAFRRMVRAFKGVYVPSVYEGLYSNRAADHKGCQKHYADLRSAKLKTLRQRMAARTKQLRFSSELVESRTTWEKLPLLMETVLFMQKKESKELLAEGVEYQTKHWEELSHRIIAKAKARGAGHEDILNDVRDVVIFVFRPNGTQKVYSDDILLNGGFLPYYIEVLKELQEMPGGEDAPTVSSRYEDTDEEDGDLSYEEAVQALASVTNPDDFEELMELVIAQFNLDEDGIVKLYSDIEE